MSTTDTNPTDTSTPDGARTEGRCSGHCHRRGRHGGARKALGFLLFFGALVGIPWAVAHAAGPHGCHGWRGAPESAEELRERMDKPAGWVLGRIDATEEQEAKVDAVLDRVAPELFALHGDHEALRQELKAALTAPAVDPAAIEQVRKDGLALADEASAVVLGGLVEIAQALTVEQRVELAEQAERFHR